MLDFVYVLLARCSKRFRRWLVEHTLNDMREQLRGKSGRVISLSPRSAYWPSWSIYVIRTLTLENDLWLVTGEEAVPLTAEKLDGYILDYYYHLFSLDTTNALASKLTTAAWSIPKGYRARIDEDLYLTDLSVIGDNPMLRFYDAEGYVNRMIPLEHLDLLGVRLHGKLECWVKRPIWSAHTVKCRRMALSDVDPKRWYVLERRNDLSPDDAAVSVAPTGLGDGPVLYYNLHFTFDKTGIANYVFDLNDIARDITEVAKLESGYEASTVRYDATNIQVVTNDATLELTQYLSRYIRNKEFSAVNPELKPLAV